MAKARISIKLSTGSDLIFYDEAQKIDESYIISVVNKFKTDETFVVLNEFDFGRKYATVIRTEYVVAVTVQEWD